jgi:alanyl-tRNA synthetase
MKETNNTLKVSKVIPGKKIYELKATHGFPLVCALDELKKEGLVVDWVGYFKASLEEGQVFEKEVKGVENAILDAYDEEYLERWKRRSLSHLYKLLKEHNEKEEKDGKNNDKI